MNSNITSVQPGNPDDLQVARQIDSICDSFEQSWKSGKRPDLTEYLRHTEVPKSTLFVELVLIDIAYRRRQGDEPSIDEYVDRFPDFREVLTNISLHSATARTEAVAETAHFGRLGRFELVERLGEGAFGIVWKAWDTKLERWVAVKQFRSVAPHHRKVFEREARAVAQLDHENVVRILELGQQEESDFIVFELIEGPTLGKWVRRRRTSSERTGLPPEQAARIALQLARGLQQVHERGVIHRDFKPGNILMDRCGVPKIADFGLARHVDSLTTISDEKTILGTVPYMSPEQCQGKRVDARTDVYSLGVVLYEILTGRRPFEGSRSELLQRIPTERPVPPGQVVEGIPPSLENVCMKTLAKEPADRYASAAELQADLERFLNGDEIGEYRRSLPVRMFRWVRRNALVAASAAVALLAVSLATGAIATIIASMPEDGRRAVTLNTTPEGARVAFVPLRNVTGEPVPEEIHHARGTTPIRERLLPGKYLVVAYLDDGSDRFHEVYRRVPEEHESLVGAFRHQSWKVDSRDERTVILPGVRIPEADVTKGMAYVEGKERTGIGIPGSTVVPYHHRSIPGFYIDPVETTLDDYVARRNGRVSKPPDLRWQRPPTPQHALTLSWDAALTEIEAAGKRLPHAVEYEYAAGHLSSGSQPWSLPPERASDEFRHRGGEGMQQGFLAVGQPAFDRLDTSPPVYGLFSNVAEWTATWATAYDPGHEEFTGIVEEFPSRVDDRVVKGGNLATLDGDPGIDANSRDHRQRLSVSRSAVRPGLGFRGVRSARPRLRPEDFIRVVEFRE